MQAIERIKDGWKQFRTCSSDDFAVLIAHIDKLEAENERLRKDAERKPMTDDKAYALAGAVFPYSQHAKCLELIRDVESHYKIGPENG